MLTVVPDLAAIQPPRRPPLTRIDGGEIVGVVSPRTVRDYVAAAVAVVREGTTTFLDAAAARPPVVKVPGLIHGTALEDIRVNEGNGGIVPRPEQVTPLSIEAARRAALDPVTSAARAERRRALVGTNGRDLAVSTVLRVIAARVRP